MSTGYSGPTQGGGYDYAEIHHNAPEVVMSDDRHANAPEVVNGELFAKNDNLTTWHN